jgi:hypothetical protein
MAHALLDQEEPRSVHACLVGKARLAVPHRQHVQPVFMEPVPILLWVVFAPTRIGLVLFAVSPCAQAIAMAMGFVNLPTRPHAVAIPVGAALTVLPVLALEASVAMVAHAQS